MATLTALKKKKSSRFGPNEFILFLPEIRELLSQKDFNQLKGLVNKLHSIDIAEGWHKLEASEKIIVFKLLNFKKAVEVFEDLKFEQQSYLLNNLDNIQISSILNEMAADERADFFKDLSPKRYKKLFSLMKKEEVDDVTKLLNFEEDSAGSLMTTEFVTIKKEMTARQALISIQESQKTGSARDIYSVYVTEGERYLVGVLPLQTLITAPSTMLIKDIMADIDAIKIEVNEDTGEVANKFSRYDLLDAPVVNERNQLIGIITIDDVVDLMQQEATREFYEIGKMQPKGGEEIRYTQTSIKDLVKRRAGWIILLLMFQVFSGWILKTFEHALGTVVALAFFIPMLLDTGGNAGSQTTVTVVRSLAIGDAGLKNIWRVVRLEVLGSLVMSVIVGVMAFLRAYWLQQDFLLSLVVAVTIMAIVVVAISTGVFLPFLAKRLGLDPAALAGPITTTVVDVVGLIIYFKIAQFFLPVLR
jgi:magnesium transporter